MTDSVASDTFAASGLDGERSGRPGILRNILGWEDPNRGRSAKQYVQSMQSTYLAIRAQGGALPEVITQDIEAVFARWAKPEANWASADAWADAFRCERLMVSLYDPARLEVELERRILEAQEHRLAIAEFYRGRLAPEGAAPEARVGVQRALLARLIGDLQWYYNQRDLKRSYAHQAQKRVFWTFLVCLLIFLAVMYLTFGVAGTEAG
jgi:hypothetical protein